MKPLSPSERWVKAWAVLMPHITAPGENEMDPWMRFPEVHVDRAILRCSRRYARNMIPVGFEPVHAYKYVWFIANEAAKTERKRVLSKLHFGFNATDTVTADEVEADGNRA
jgi:hypothetical protein